MSFDEIMKMSFDEWIEKLRLSNPNLDWDLMTEVTMAELRDAHGKIEKEECSEK